METSYGRLMVTQRVQCVETYYTIRLNIQSTSVIAVLFQIIKKWQESRASQKSVNHSNTQVSDVLIFGFQKFKS